MWQGGKGVGCVEIIFQSGSFQFVMLMPIRITLWASKRHEAVLRLPKALGLAMKWADERDRYRERQRFAVKRRTARGGFDKLRMTNAE